MHGNYGLMHFLDELKRMRLQVKEFHVSDVSSNKKIKNRIAMEVGTGSIDWKLILPLLLQHCNEFLIETLGGIKVFQRSKSYNESLTVKKIMRYYCESYSDSVNHVIPSICLIMNYKGKTVNY